MIMVYDYCSSPESKNYHGPQSYYIVMATDEEGDIAYEHMAPIYRQMFQSSCSAFGPFGPFLDKGQLASFAQAVAREMGAEKVVLHSASDWNRLLEKVRDTKRLEEILHQGEVLQGVEQGATRGLLKRFFKDS